MAVRVMAGQSIALPTRLHPLHFVDSVCACWTANSILAVWQHNLEA